LLHEVLNLLTAALLQVWLLRLLFKNCKRAMKLASCQSIAKEGVHNKLIVVALEVQVDLVDQSLEVQVDLVGHPFHLCRVDLVVLVLVGDLHLQVARPGLVGREVHHLLVVLEVLVAANLVGDLHLQVARGRLVGREVHHLLVVLVVLAGVVLGVVLVLLGVVLGVVLGLSCKSAENPSLQCSAGFY